MPNSDLVRLRDQLRRTLEGEAWHGPALLELLADVTSDEALAHPIPGAHSIWEIVLHLGAIYGLVLRRTQGDARPLTAAEDWPPVPAPTAENWRAAVGRLREQNVALRDALARFSPDRLDEPLAPEPAYSAYTQFIGLTQHDLYHAGQISLLKKVLRGVRPV